MDHFLNILMVDDDQDDHDMFRASLKDVHVDGFKVSDIVRVTSLYNGAQAISYLNKKDEFKSSKTVVPDFIVLDLNMPVVDGFTVLQEIRNSSDLKSIPVYVLTTSRDDAHKQKCLHLNCAGYFSKPSTKVEITQIIGQMLDVQQR